MVSVPTGAREELKLSKLQVGLIFDGETEQNSFPARLCKKTCDFYKRKRTINGKTATLEKIANECIDILQALDSRGAKISFLVIDREDKTISASSMGQNLTTLIASKFTGNFIVIVADTMFENWLVADIENLKNKFPDLIKASAVNGNNDGQHGEGIMKSYWGGVGTFKKNVHGPKFFKAIRIDEAITRSPSFDYLISQLRGQGVVIY